LERARPPRSGAGGLREDAAALRRGPSRFERDAFFHGQPLDRSGRKDIAWIAPDAREMEAEDWASDRRSVGFFLRRAADAVRGE